VLLLNIPEACDSISESLLDCTSILFSKGIEFHSDHLTFTPSCTLVEEQPTLAIFNIERQNTIRSFCDAFGENQRGYITYRYLECIKTAAACSSERIQCIVQLIASFINLMLTRIKNSTDICSSSVCTLLCVDFLLDEDTDLTQNSLCLVAPVATWLNVLAQSRQTEWVAVSTACSLWNAAVASVISKSNASISGSKISDDSIGESLEVASLALRRIASLQPPQNFADEVAVACNCCNAAFQAISSAVNSANSSTNFEIDQKIVSLVDQCSQSHVSYTRCGALLHLHNIVLEHWLRLTAVLQDSLFHAVETCLFDGAAAVYVAAVEVLCAIGRVDPSSAFSFGSKFLARSSNEDHTSRVSCSWGTGKGRINAERGLEEHPLASRHLALCKVFDALGDVVRKHLVNTILSNQNSFFKKIIIFMFRC
jgi:hypothetical protein